MSTTEGMEEKRGISRRDLIKKGAVAGAIVWTVPMIESVPAYAATGSIAMGCSYFTVVWQYYDSSNILQTVCNKFTGTGQSTGNGTSSDNTFCWMCGTDRYDNLAGNKVSLNGTVVNDGPANASDYFTFNGDTVTPGPNVVKVLFAVAHKGNFTGTNPAGVYIPHTTVSGSVCDSTFSSTFRVMCNPSTITFNCT